MSKVAARSVDNGEGAAETRRLIVLAAEGLFAEQGIDGVSLAQINRTAGQRNATALHYHFGGKEGLLRAIFDKHTPRISALRATMLESLPASAGLGELMPVLVRPLAEQVRDEDGGVDYLVFLAQVMNHPGIEAAALDKRDDPVLQDLQRRFVEATREIPPQLLEIRTSLVMTLVFNALADYAQKVKVSGLDSSRHSLFVDQLATAAVAVFSG